MSSKNPKQAEAKVNAIIAARAQLGEVVAGRSAGGWKKTFHERAKKTLEQAEHEKPFEELFLCDHPEWRNPHAPDTDTSLKWELENLYARREAFQQWLAEQKK